SGHDLAEIHLLDVAISQLDTVLKKCARVCLAADESCVQSDGENGRHEPNFPFGKRRVILRPTTRLKQSPHQPSATAVASGTLPTGEGSKIRIYSSLSHWEKSRR